MLVADAEEAHMTGVKGVPVLVFYCRGTARSLRFYRNVLGIPGEFDQPRAEASSLPEGDRPHAGAAWLHCGNLRILLHPAPEVTHGGISVYFEVEDPDVVVNRAARAGYQIIAQPRDHPLRGRIAAVLDPDGRRIDLVRPIRSMRERE